MKTIIARIFRVITFLILILESWLTPHFKGIFMYFSNKQMLIIFDEVLIFMKDPIKVKFRRLLAVIGHCRSLIDYKIQKPPCSTRFGCYWIPLSTNYRESIAYCYQWQALLRKALKGFQILLHPHDPRRTTLSTTFQILFADKQTLLTFASPEGPGAEESLDLSPFFGFTFGFVIFANLAENFYRTCVASANWQPYSENTAFVIEHARIIY